MARHVARTLVKEGLAPNVLVKITYTAGQKHVTHVEARSGTGEDLSELVRDRFDFRPESIVEELGLTIPIYQKSSILGTFGRSETPWG